ncbi:MAG: DNA methyltransferase [Anaerolineaceae bacterium]|nr:DNA methyltransferase [Anaerolineaceae bacterium]
MFASSALKNAIRDKKSDAIFGEKTLDPTFMANRDAPVHRWVPWIAGFSKYFVQEVIEVFATSPSVVLDPFAGVGTTLVEADVAGNKAIGFEINPYAAFASRTKLSAHRLDTRSLQNSAQDYIDFISKSIQECAKPKSVPPKGFRTRVPFYSPPVEHKVLLTLDFISSLEKHQADVFRLAFAATMVDYSNYSYEPSLGRKEAAGRPNVEDYDVANAFAEKISQMAIDAKWYRESRKSKTRKDGEIYEQSFFDGYTEIQKGTVDLLITSPPYLNNYHYNRNTRPHLYWLGFCSKPSDLKRLEELNFGTYWQNARAEKDVELDPSINDKAIQQALENVRSKNPEKGIYGGSGWANYGTRYFNDCARFVRGAAWCLRPGASAFVVIGNSILQGVPIPTDLFLAKIAAKQGFRVVNIHVPRNVRVGNSITNSKVRAGKSNGSALYEAVVELRRN